MNEPLPYKISVLVFLTNEAGDQLLIERTREPNKGCWSPIGGKLEMEIGESPHECAVREVAEETGLRIQSDQLHLFAMIAEKAYEGNAHWLMFLFTCRQTVKELPPAIDEGRFGFFSRKDLETVSLPETDRRALWPIYDRFKDGFVAMRADCHPDKDLQVVLEETLIAPRPGPSGILSSSLSGSP